MPKPDQVIPKLGRVTPASKKINVCPRNCRKPRIHLLQGAQPIYVCLACWRLDQAEDPPMRPIGHMARQARTSGSAY